MRGGIVCGVLAWLIVAGGAVAQERDPTAAPPEMAAASGGSAAQQPWGADGMAVLVRDGKPYLVVDTRLYAVGQKVGAFQIERITESEVWLREGTTVRKVARFAGIARHEVAAAPAAAASAPAPQAKSRKARKMNKKATAP